MRAFVRLGLAALSALWVLTLAAGSHAQGPATAKGAAAPPGSVPARPDPAVLKQVLATVNGEAITRRDLIEFLNQYNLPPDDHEMIYRDAIETLINTRLVTQYLERLKIPVSPERVDAAVNDLKKQLQEEGKSLAQVMLETGKSMEELRKIYADRIRWVEFVKLRGTDTELQKFADSHKELLNGTQVKASHILMKVEPKATPAEKEQARQRLLALKRDIETKKYTFAQAANKFSEDRPAISEQGGGDIGYFGLGSGIVEEFATAAFALKPGQISDPVETPYGYHLILVTDRKEGPKVDFQQQKPAILNQYSAELQKSILTTQRKTAKIDIKPMPADLFAPAPAPTSGNAPVQPKGAALPK